MRILALLISMGRFVFGVAFIAKPKLMERAWIGKQARIPGAQLLARAVGTRDLVLGLGGLQALTRDDGSAALAGGRGDPRRGRLRRHVGSRSSHPATGPPRRARDRRRVLSALDDRGRRNRRLSTCLATALWCARPDQGQRRPERAARHGLTAGDHSDRGEQQREPKTVRSERRRRSLPRPAKQPVEDALMGGLRTDRGHDADGRARVKASPCATRAWPVANDRDIGFGELEQLWRQAGE